MERQYIGARYVPVFANPIEWDNQRSFEALTVVNYMGASYTSKKAVPAGIKPTDTKYWVCTGNYNAQVEEYRQLAQHASDVVGVIEKELPIAENSRWVTVGGKGCNFKTINEAINAVKSYATNTNRITVFITAGTYNEEIRLLPNPGIDFVGVGKVKVHYPSVYPDAPIFMSGKANIENIEFVSAESGDSSAVHIGAQFDATETELRFNNCVFRCNNEEAGATVEMGEGYSVEFRGCKFVSTHAAPLHLSNNSKSHDNKANLRCYNCDFYSLNDVGIIVHNKRAVNGNSGVSKVELGFAGCVCNPSKVRYERGDTVLTYIPVDDSEFIVDPISRTAILGLDYKHRKVVVGGDFLCHRDSALVPYAGANQYDWVFTSVTSLSTGAQLAPSLVFGAEGNIRLDDFGVQEVGEYVRVFLEGTPK